MIIYVRGESVMTFIEWLKYCNEADPLTEKVYICNDYLNAERMLENASGENIVIRLERYTVEDHAYYRNQCRVYGQQDNNAVKC